MFNGALKPEIDRKFKSVCVRKMLLIVKCSDSHLCFHIILKPWKGN